MGIQSALKFFAVLTFLTVTALSADAQGMLLPVQGTWGAIQAPSCPDGTNHHCRYSAQMYAYDFVLLTPTGQAANCIGAPVYSPSNGTVIAVLNLYPNFPAPGQHIAGNHVVIQRSPNEYITMAHLTKDSITVFPGSTVQAGQLIGQCGFNGNSSGPHLHIHMQSLPNPLDFNAIGLPMIFTNARVFRPGIGCVPAGGSTVPKGAYLC